MQNWESGIEATVIGSTFYRNLGTWAGALAVVDAWPLVWTVDRTDFIQNEALVTQHELVYWSAPGGPEVRSGITSATTTGSHYDGGYNSAGFFIWACGTLTLTDGDGPDEPDATWDVTYSGCDYIDHAGWWTACAIILQILPVMPDHDLHLNVNVFDTSLTDSVILDPGTWVDASYAVISTSVGYASTVRCRFERSGNFDQSLTGTGGFHAIVPAGGSIVPTYEFLDSEWL